MKLPFNARAPSFDAAAINATIQRALASAGLDTTAGPMRDVTETIRRALAAGAPAQPEAPLHCDAVIYVDAREVPSRAGLTEGAALRDQPVQQAGRFEAHHFSSDTGSLAYKLYVPHKPAGAPRAMVVMLHGCTQSADDFAAGTQMNRLANEHGFLVVYPEQAAHANPGRCWNWFSPQDQQRGSGEPALIAGLVAEVAHVHSVDPGRIFVAGLSAGAAMAVVLGETYPELFAGVGAHSGLPYGSAHDIPSAMSAMKGGRGANAAQTGARRNKALQPVPTIVFHGDRDHTVQHSNGEAIVLQALDAHEAALGRSGLQVSTHAGVAPGGRRFKRTVHCDAQGFARIESWTVSGAGHAWSGGHASGSYADATGPDASAEMVRFFMALPGTGTA